MMELQIITFVCRRTTLDSSILNLLICFLLSFKSISTFSVLREIEEMIINSCNGNAHNVSSTFENLCSKFVDILRLKIQLSLFSKLATMIMVWALKVTVVSSVCELFETFQFPKTMLKEVHKALLHFT